MTKHNKNLIEALKKAFTDDDIISDGATDWDLFNLIMTIEAGDAEWEEVNGDDEAEFYAERGRVYKVDAAGYIESIAIYTLA